MTIALVDTSVFCNILRVPGYDQDYDQVMQGLEHYIRTRVHLLLPVATILETGNHIAHLKNGQVRRQTAVNFVKAVRDALDEQAPWTVSRPLLDPKDLRDYLAQFPDAAMRGISLGDFSIIQEYARLCKLHRERYIFIWSLDKDLGGYERPAKL